jgi:formylglycine-generating enzyme required for sulfatase activity
VDRTHLTYLDFELEIGQGEGRKYPVVVVRSPAGEARETMRFPYDELALENRLLMLQNALLRSGGKYRLMPSPEEQAVQEFGGSLFEALLAGEARSRYDVSQRVAAEQDKGLRLKLRIQPPELAALPWEFLYDPRQADYVCLSRSTPVVRYLELPQPIQPLTVAPPLRILGMIAAPHDLPPLDVMREKQRLEKAIEGVQARGLVEMAWLEGQTWRDLQRVLRAGPWHVFHFVGHGGFDRQADEGFIALVDDEGDTYRLKAGLLGRLLADHGSLRLAVLNACEGARGGRRDIFSSTASILVQRGIPAVVAMQYEITDRAAIELGHAFYEALAEGMPVDAALAEARKAVSLAVTNSVEWGTPVLYMRSPDGMLFTPQMERKAREQAAKEEAGREVEQLPAKKAERIAADKPEVERVEPELLEPIGRKKTAWRQRYLPYLIVVGLLAVILVVGRVVVIRLVGGADRSTSKPQPPPNASLHNTWTRTTDGMAMVYVPGGTFEMGSTQAELDAAVDQCESDRGSDQCEHERLDDETPLHSVTLDGFWIDQTEVTNAQYARCVAAGACRPPSESSSYLRTRYYGASQYDNHPVIWVTWNDTRTYCGWAGGRLPTEAEWEYAARGPDGRVYPWGNDSPNVTLLNYNWNVGDTTEVGSYPEGKSWVGALDMAGNAWEWVNDWYADDYYAKASAENPTGPDVGNRKVLRGGAWSRDPVNLRSAYRDKNFPDFSYYNVGFRCVVTSTSSP